MSYVLISCASHNVFLAELSIPIMLTTESDSIPSVPPYNTFQFTCEADVPALLGSVPFELQWFRETGPEQQQPVSPDSSTSIETSDTEPVSVLTATRSSPGQYVYYCEIRYLSGDDVVAFASSISNGVTVTGKDGSCVSRRNCLCVHMTNFDPKISTQYRGPH